MVHFLFLMRIPPSFDCNRPANIHLTAFALLPTLVSKQINHEPNHRAVWKNNRLQRPQGQNSRRRNAA